MKLLWDNVLSDQVFSADNFEEDSQNSLTALSTNILEEPFKITDYTSQIEFSVELPTAQTVNSVAFGFHNLTYFSIEIQDSSAATVLAETEVPVDYESNAAYFDDIEAKTIIFRAETDTTTLYIGELAVADAMSFDTVQADSVFTDSIRGSAEKTVGGQLSGSQAAQLITWSVTQPLLSNDERLAVRAMLKSVGNWQPFFADLYEDAHDIEPPMFCNFTDGTGVFERRSYNRTYSFAIELEECR